MISGKTACVLAIASLAAIPLVHAREFHVTVDFNDDYFKAGGPVQPDNVDNLMVRFAELGIGRVYLTHHAEDFLLPRPLTDPQVDLIECAVEAAHRHGMKLYALFKPFETGLGPGVFGFPQNAPVRGSDGAFEGVAGLYPYLSPFVREHPDFRIQRKPFAEWRDKTIETIKLVKINAKPTRLKKEHLQILTSAINGDFQPYEGAFQFRDTLEERDGRRVRVLVLSGLNIPARQRYVMVLSALTDAQGDFRNLDDRIMEIYDTDGTRIPATSDEGVVRQFHLETWLKRYYLQRFAETSLPANVLPPDHGHSKRTSMFYFDAGHRLLMRTLDGIGPRDGVSVVAKGKNPYMIGALHPIYPEVRKYWVDEIRSRCIGAGVDGVAIRTGNHSSWTAEADMYGFNPPVVAEYRRRWRVDILTEPFDVEKWKQLQGEYLTLFLRELKQELARHGLPLQVSVNHSMLREIPGWRKNDVPANFTYEWENWIVEDIADSIELKYIPWPWVPHKGRGEELIEEITGLARKHNKRVFANVRLEVHVPWWEVGADGQPAITAEDKRLAGLRKDLCRAWHNPHLDGVILYEAAGFTKMDPATGETWLAPFMKGLLDDLRRVKKEPR